MIFFRCCVKANYLFWHSVDLRGRHETPAGGRDRGDPAGASAEEASRTACGKRSARSANQQHYYKVRGGMDV
jgi:hypothetical protein